MRESAERQVVSHAESEAVSDAAPDAVPDAVPGGAVDAGPVPGAPYPATLAEFAEWAADRYGPLPALRFRPRDDGAGTSGAGTGGVGTGGAAADGWAVTTYDELRERVRSIGRGLLGLGVAAGDRVAVFAETRPEWTHAQLAVFAAGAVVVPVYPTAGDEEITWVLGDSGTSVIICEDAAGAERIERLRPELPELRHVIVMAGGASPADTPPFSPAPRPLLAALPERAPLDALLARAATRTADDVASIVYTSGTTGPPKGCLLSHGNINAVRDGTLDLGASGPGDAVYVYLPLAHVMAQLIVLKTLLQGATVCYFGGRVENILTELGEARPTHLPSVPRLFEKVHAMALALAEAGGDPAGSGGDPAGSGGGAEGGSGGRERFEAAVRLGVRVAEMREAGHEPTGELRERWEAAEKTLYAPVRAAFGGRLRWALTGAAPIPRATLDFLRACGIDVYEGYGMTESGGVIACTRPGAVKPGTVGRPMPGCEVRIAEDGEVLARGANVFLGYHRNEAATRAAVDSDGWLHTGDLGSFDEDGYLTISGRKKDLIITSAGKNLAPTQVEQAIQESRWISRAVMIGDRRPYPVALLTLDLEEVEGGARDGRRTGQRPAQPAPEGG
ncbi:AMP-dependent synthetase/ligase, partial [Streptomyces sp. URMC 123]|uniref:AMP-dependent synthetase/ligase n=1 Tax=Streptomyces sp. URMC 123 TaxID=3423403 RepID=UPI003F1DD554